jgi:hypothetical protein
VFSREKYGADKQELVDAQTEVKLIKDVISKISFNAVLNQLE